MPIPVLRADSTVSSSSPENLDNYLRRIEEAKAQIDELNKDILKLQSEKQDLISDNSATFSIQRERIQSQQVEASSVLSRARQEQLNATNKASEVDKFHSDLINEKQRHSEQVAAFKDECDSKKGALQAALNEVYSQKEINEQASSSNRNMKIFLSEIEASLNERESKIIAREKQLQAEIEKNKTGDSARIEAMDALQKQSDKIHADIATEVSGRATDIIRMQAIADTAKAERGRNEAILLQIEERAQGLQDKILNLKLVSSDIDRKKNELIQQQERTGEMISRLQSLKDELSKEQVPAKIEEAPK